MMLPCASLQQTSLCSIKRYRTLCFSHCIFLLYKQNCISMAGLPEWKCSEGGRQVKLGCKMGRCMAKDENHWYITSHHSVFVTNRRIQIQCFVNTEQYIRICFKGELSSFSLLNHTSAYADAAALKEFCENAKPGKFGDNTRCLIVQRSSPTKYLARAAWDQVILRAATVVAHKNGFVNLSSKLYQVLQRDVSTLVSCDKHQACLWLQWCACWQAECLKNALVDGRIVFVWVFMEYPRFAFNRNDAHHVCETNEKG